MCVTSAKISVAIGAVFLVVIRHAVVHIEIVYYFMLSGLFKIAKIGNRTMCRMEKGVHAKWKQNITMQPSSRELMLIKRIAKTKYLCILYM